MNERLLAQKGCASACIHENLSRLHPADSGTMVAEECSGRFSSGPLAWRNGLTPSRSLPVNCREPRPWNEWP